MWLVYEITWSITFAGLGEHSKELIHSADPQSRPVVIIAFAHVVRSYIRPYVHVRPHFSKQNKIQAKTMFSTLGLAERIIDDTPVWLRIIIIELNIQLAT